MSIRRAEAEIADLQSQIGEWEREIATARKRIAKLEAYIEVTRDFEGTSGRSEEPALRRGGPTKLEVFAAAIREIITAAGGRLPTANIHEKLLERGMDVGGTNPITNLSSILSRAGEFENDRRLGWGFKEQPSKTAPADQEQRRSGDDSVSPSSDSDDENYDPRLSEWAADTARDEYEENSA